MIPIILYHGTISAHKHNFEANGINLAKAKQHVDFGLGFYMSDTYSFAADTARNSAQKYNNMQNDFVCPMLLTITVSETELSKLSFRVFKTTDEEWLRFVIYNRACADIQKEMEKEIKYKPYDVVCGPIADARIVSLVEKINKRQLNWNEAAINDVLPYKGGNDKQFAFVTKASLRCLKISSLKILL